MEGGDWPHSVGWDALRRPSGPGRLERVGQSGHSDPIFFLAALRAAGRSVGAQTESETKKKRKRGSVGQGRRVHFQLHTPRGGRGTK